MHAARLDVDVKERESIEDLKKMAHPWACVTHMLLVDSALDSMTTCICCTNSCLFMMCKIGLGKKEKTDGAEENEDVVAEKNEDAVAEKPPDPSD